MKNRYEVTFNARRRWIKGRLGTPGHYVDLPAETVILEVEVDLQALAQMLAMRIDANKTGRAMALGGVVKARRMP